MMSSPPKTERESAVYRAVNGTPSENMSKVMDLAGGIGAWVGAEDVVVIKPNVQWWNHGGPNLSALKTFVELIMTRPDGFRGEVVWAENCHRGPAPWNAGDTGWRQIFTRNSDLDRMSNYHQLGAVLKQTYGDRFSICHLIDVDAGGRRVFGPADGPGYVYCDGTGGVPLFALDNKLAGAAHRAVMMTYPIFKTDRGTLIDFRNGIWSEGAYTGQPFKFINFSAANHHSVYCGMTGAIKNYLGVSDLSGGPDPRHNGKLTDEYYNFHSFPFNKWAAGPAPGMIGDEIGMFMDTIRRADLNVITVEWLGLVSRTEPPVAHTRSVLAGTDPVALDFHAAKYFLYPNSLCAVHDPGNRTGPLYQYLEHCAGFGGGVLDERSVRVQSFDFRTNTLQPPSDWTVVGKKQWGMNPKMLAKYLWLRYAGGLAGKRKQR